MKENRLLRGLISMLLLFTAVGMTAKPELSTEKRYHIVCGLYPDGCVADGVSTGATTPLYYLTAATADDASYWLITETEEGSGLYTIRNAATGKYITYDGQRTDANSADDGMTRRYVDMTATTDGDNSLWEFVKQSDGVYAIRNAAQTDHIWDVRATSYVVGTYSNSGSANGNQQFSLYDEDGMLVTEVTIPAIEGLNVSSWIDATTESLSGWTLNGDWMVNTGAGGSHYNDNDGANLVQPFIEYWHESSQGPLSDASMSQQLDYLPTGQYTLAADMIAVRQGYNNGWWGSHDEEPAINVDLFANNVTVSASTADNIPQRLTLNFSLGKTGSVELGVRFADTNANWIAIDNIQLYYHGTAEELNAGEQAKVLAELTDCLGADEAAALMANAGSDFSALEELRKKIANMPAADPLNKVARGLRIGGHTPVYVESTDLYLCPVPQGNFGSAMTATIDYTTANGNSQLTINGTAVAPGTDYTFASVTAGTNYTLAIRATDGTMVSKQLTFTSLPVVQIYGSFSNSYSDGYIVVNDPDDASYSETLNMKAKWRGGITNGGDKHKRNYHVKLKDEEGNKIERKFFGLRKDNSWILESCQVDMSRIRNRTLTDLWNDFSTPPYYITEEPKALTGTRGRFVELTLNGEYRGIYCMTENLDRKQMRLKKYDEETNTTHGQLWKSKDWSFATMMGTSPDGGYQPKYYLSDPNENSDMWDSYEVKYPDFEDYGYQTDWSTLYNAVDFVSYATDEDFRNHVAEYFDLPLVIDYYILMETVLATDNHGKNMFFGVYDKQQDKKITFGVWDMDATCGQRWSDSYYHDLNLMNPERDYAEFIASAEHGDYNLFRRLRDTDANDFNDKVRRRYRDLRQGELATENILQRFRTYLDGFKTAGADQREYARWSGDSDVAGHTLDFDDEMDYLTDWFQRRMNYLDNTRFDIASIPEQAEFAEIQFGNGKTMTGYSFNETLDFSSVTNGKAWIAAGFVENSKVMLCRVNIVPANTGFIVTCDTPGDKVIAPVSNDRAYYANLLVPILDEQTIYPTKAIGGVDYTFMGIGTITNTGKTGFVKVANERSYGPNKCLLRVPTQYLVSEARGLNELEMVFDETSSMHNGQFTMHNEAPAQIYNLNGQRMSKPGKGLNIINGKKIVIK